LILVVKDGQKCEEEVVFNATFSHGRWFSVGTPASSTTTTGRHDIAEILLKVALNTKKSNKYKCPSCFHWQNRGRRVHMVVEFTTTYATSASTVISEKLS
jgi:hypothetical protein